MMSDETYLSFKHGQKDAVPNRKAAFIEAIYNTRLSLVLGLYGDSPQTAVLCSFSKSFLGEEGRTPASL